MEEDHGQAPCFCSLGPKPIFPTDRTEAMESSGPHSPGRHAGENLFPTLPHTYHFQAMGLLTLKILE